MRVREFIAQPVVRSLVDRYRAALSAAGEGVDVGAVRGIIENEYDAQIKDNRKELRDYLDSLGETPGGPTRNIHSSFAHRRGARHE